MITRGLGNRGLIVPRGFGPRKAVYVPPVPPIVDGEYLCLFVSNEQPLQTLSKQEQIRFMYSSPEQDKKLTSKNEQPLIIHSKKEQQRKITTDETCQ